MANDEKVIFGGNDWADYLDGDSPGDWDSLSPEERDELEALFEAEDNDPSQEADQ